MALIQTETLVLPMDSCVKQSLGDPILRLLLLGDQKFYLLIAIIVLPPQKTRKFLR